MLSVLLCFEVEGMLHRSIVCFIYLVSVEGILVVIYGFFFFFFFRCLAWVMLCGFCCS